MANSHTHIYPPKQAELSMMCSGGEISSNGVIERQAMSSISGAWIFVNVAGFAHTKCLAVLDAPETENMISLKILRATSP